MANSFSNNKQNCNHGITVILARHHAGRGKLLPVYPSECAKVIRRSGVVPSGAGRNRGRGGGPPGDRWPGNANVNTQYCVPGATGNLLGSAICSVKIVLEPRPGISHSCCWLPRVLLVLACSHATVLRTHCYRPGSPVSSPPPSLSRSVASDGRSTGGREVCICIEKILFLPTKSSEASDRALKSFAWTCTRLTSLRILSHAASHYCQHVPPWQMRICL